MKNLYTYLTCTFLLSTLLSPSPLNLRTNYRHPINIIPRNRNEKADWDTATAQSAEFVPDHFRLYRSETSGGGNVSALQLFR